MARGLFCHPTVFVGTTALYPVVADVPGNGGGKWLAGSGGGLGDPLAPTYPVTQLILDGSGLIDWTKPGFVAVKPPGAWPQKDDVQPHAYSIFGTFGEFLVYADTPAYWGLHGGKWVGPVPLGIGDRITYKLRLETYFFVLCGSNQESLVALQWLDSDDLTVASSDIWTMQTSMRSDYENREIRVDPPRPTRFVDLNLDDWVR